MGNLVQTLAHPDPCSGPIFWLFHLFFDLPATFLHFSDHHPRLNGYSAGNIPCVGAMPWFWELVDLDRDLKSALCLWEHCSRELFPWKPDFSNVGAQQGGCFKRLTDKQGAASCQRRQSVLSCPGISAAMRHGLGQRGASSRGIPRMPLSAPLLPVPSPAGTTTSTSLRPLVWKPHIYLARSVRVSQGVNLIRAAAWALSVPTP